jgi:thiol-disulfide isomerase/thioredoxin
MRRFLFLERLEPPRGATLLSACLVLMMGCGQPQGSPPATDKPPATREKTTSLKVGDLLPAVAPDGWIKGPPPSPASPGLSLLVVDVWAAWCPYCRQTAPGLVRLHRKHADRGVHFLSVTSMGREPAQAFSDQFQIPWPSGYGLSEEGVVALGAGSGVAGPGYEIAPVLYIVGPDGRIRWADQQGRFLHKSPEVWERELDEAIVDLLPAR